MVAFPVPGHAGNSAGGHPMLYHAVCLPVLPELHDEAAGRKLNKRLHSLLVPYLLWNAIIYYVAYVAASRIPDCRRSPTGRIW